MARSVTADAVAGGTSEVSFTMDGIATVRPLRAGPSGAQKRGRRFGGGNENRHHARTKYSTLPSLKSQPRYCTAVLYDRCVAVYHKISTSDRTHARTGPDTQRAQAHNHTQNSKPRTHPCRQTSRSHAHTHTSRHTPSATPTRERTRQGNHRLRELHRPLRQRLGW